MDSHGSGSGRGRTRRRVAIGVVAATVALLAVTILPSSAASSVPQLKLTQTASGWTKVAWTFTSSDHAQDMQLQIDRGPDAAHFAKWLVINRPEKNSFRYDKDGKHTIVYRARLSVKGVFGGWSNPISLAGVGSTAPPSTPPTTTVKPTTTTVKPTTTTTTVPVTTHACSDAAKADVLRFINTERAKVGAKPLVMNTELAAAAQAHTAWMVKNNVMHSPPNNPDWWQNEIVFAGYTDWGAIGQNLGGGQVDSHSIVYDAWMGSPGHKATMLDPIFNHIGVGCQDTTTGWLHYWTADFGANGR
jgi:uncharacterized protein YkwD